MIMDLLILEVDGSLASSYAASAVALWSESARGHRECRQTSTIGSSASEPMNLAKSDIEVVR